MSLTIINGVMNVAVGVQPTVDYPPGNVGDLILIHFVSRILTNAADLNGRAYSLVSGISNGSQLNSQVYWHVTDGLENKIQFSPYVQPPSTQLEVAYQIYRLRGQTASPIDGEAHSLAASGTQMSFPNAITTAPNDMVLLFGGCTNVLTSGVANDTVTGYTKLGSAYDQVSGVEAFSNVQATAGNTGAPSGTHVVGSGGTCGHTLCIFAAAGSGGGGGGAKARNFAVTIG